MTEIELGDVFGLPAGKKRGPALFWVLVFLGVYKRCTRCHGTGRHGPQHVHGGRCFACDGRRYQSYVIDSDEASELTQRAGEVRAFMALVLARRCTVLEGIQAFQAGERA